jgi:hypothetical protein
VLVTIRVEIKLSDKTFNEELKNKSSPAYIELKNDVYVEVFLAAVAVLYSHAHSWGRLFKARLRLILG